MWVISVHIACPHMSYWPTLVLSWKLSSDPFQMASMCFFRYELHTDWAYSRCGLTRAVKSILNIGASRYSKEHLMRPAIELALLIVLEICLSKFKLVSITTPKSFSSSDLSNFLPSIEYGQASTYSTKSTDNLQNILTLVCRCAMHFILHGIP